MKKLINGVEVTLSPQEAAAVRADWQKGAERQAARAARTEADNLSKRDRALLSLVAEARGKTEEEIETIFNDRVENIDAIRGKP